MWRRTLIAAAGIISLHMLAVEAMARQMTLEPTRIVRLVNPSDNGDVVILFWFDFPAELSDKVIVRSQLELTGLGDDEVPLMVETLGSSFSQGTTWRQLSEARAEASSSVVALVEPATNGDTSTNMTKVVRGWVAGEFGNFGLVVSGISTGERNSGEALDSGVNSPILRIVYTRKVDE